MAHAPIWGLGWLGWPRPGGWAILAVTGHLGITGSIVFMVMLVLLNIALSAMLFRRVLQLPLNGGFLVGYLLYTYLAYAHPHFYEFYTHDGLGQIAYFFLLIGAWYWFAHSTQPRWRDSAVIGAIALYAFLCKENFGVAACLLAVGVAWYDRRAWHLALSVCMALGLALFYSVLIKSQFMHDSAGGTYHVVLAPSSVIREWWHYLREAFSPASAAILLFCLARMAYSKNAHARTRRCAILLLLILPAVLLPNALLPEHHYAGYSWAVCYLAFLPLLYLFSLPFPARPLPRQVAGPVALACAVLVVPLLQYKEFRRSDWVVAMEHNQRNLMTGLRAYGKDDPLPGRKVLVTGLIFPFNPFEQPLSLRSKPYWRDIQFDVLEYGPHRDANDPLIRFIGPGAVTAESYTEVWLFAKDGMPLGKFKARDLAADFQGTDSVGLRRVDYLLYPQLLTLIDPRRLADGAVPDGPTLLKMGETLNDYAAFEKAERLFRLSLTMLPDNPYPRFFLGKTLESQGKYAQALASYDEALALDAGKNTYFVTAREAVAKKLHDKPVN
jgi:hypothetical protein